MIVRLGRFLPVGYDLPVFPGVEDFHDPEQLIASNCDAFLVETADHAVAVQVAEKIRSHPATAFAPVFSSSSCGSYFDLLTDGTVSSPQEAATRAGEMLAFLSEIDRDAVLKSADFRLLAWNYIRKGAEMVPLADPCSEEIYFYPVARCMADHGVNHIQWLDEMRIRGQLEQGRLVDRLRACPKCASPHLNYIDVCPNCGAIDIAKKELVHCFTCGRVGLMENFLRENAMICPFCGIQLRHLGSDYDHPLESVVCESCRDSFIDPAVVASCFNCRAKSETTDLNVVSLYAYRISEKGRISARVGEMENAYAIFDRLGNVSLSYFEQFLDWNLNLLRRYKEENSFTIVAIRFTNIEAIGDAVGGSRMAQMIDAITVRLKELLRTTDVVMRSSLGVLCFLLPHTNEEQSRVVTSRVYGLRDQVSLADAPKLDISIVSRTFPKNRDVVADEKNAKEILANIFSQV